MKTGSIKLLFIFCLATLISCEEDFLVHQGTFKPSIVVNSIFSVNKPWIVHLSYSRNILDKNTENSPILDAGVEIIEIDNGRIIALKHVAKGEYKSDIYLPQADKNYELIVHVDGYREVTALSSSPKNADVVKINSEEFDAKTTKVNFEIKDLVNNYYIWNVVFANTKNPLDTSFSGSPKYLISSVKKYNELSTYLNNIAIPIKNDASAKGGLFFSYNLSSLDASELGGHVTGENEEATANKKYLRLLTTSKELYSYYKTVEKFIEIENLNSSFSQSPEIFSNVKNGLGIFAGYTEKYIEIKN